MQRRALKLHDCADKRRILPVSNSPKPPPERITFSLPVVNAAKEVVFVALGAGKAEIVQRVLEVRLQLSTRRGPTRPPVQRRQSLR